MEGGVPSHSSPQEQRKYRQVACDQCGLIVPQNEDIPSFKEELVGRSGPSRRSTFSFGSRSFRDSSSSSSGRNYYKEHRVFLCSNCFRIKQEVEQKIALERSKSAMWKIGGWAAFILFIIIYNAAKH